MTLHRWAFAAAMVIALSACSWFSDGDRGDKLTPANAPGGKGSTDGLPTVPLTDVPVPNNVKLDPVRTLIFGSRDDWSGRAHFDTPYTLVEMFEFYRREMASFGWAEISVVRAEASALVFSRMGRVATIQIFKSSILTGGATVSVLMTPNSAAGGGGPAAGQGGNVTARPLR
ncbi:MAG: hypothetical protein FJX46_06650 [Alphaproteobacteria bacterium]|nr:hypothetical protein [Alphaproteobacteria bacterium]